MTGSDDALARVAEYHPTQIDLSLGRIRRLLHDMARPHEHLPPTIHVAGTNGKGSTVAFLHGIAEAAGLSCHVYTSPHLKRFHERIRLGKPGGGSVIVDHDTLSEVLERVDRINRGQPITFFEITTAAALELFAHHPADLFLCEVGLGGRFDATNVIGSTHVACLTQVGLDHVEFLGPDIAGIAREKTGIARSGRPFVIGPQVPEARISAVETADQLGASAFVHGRDWQAREEQGRLIYQDEDQLLDLPMPARLLGRHQIANAGVAVAAFQKLQAFPVASETLGRGIRDARWAGRLTRLTEGAFYKAARRGGAEEVWADGAHNPPGAEALAEVLAEMGAKDGRPLVLVVALLVTKDAGGIFQAFQGLARTVRTVAPPNTDAPLDPHQAAHIALSVGVDARAAASLEEAATMAAASAPGCRLVLCGSLYAVAGVLPEGDPLG